MSVEAFKQAISLLHSVGLEMDVRRPVSDSDIELCEREIGFKLPDSYKFFLSRYGFGGAASIEFYGLISGDLRKDSYLNAFTFNQELQNDYDFLDGFPKELFAFENFEGDAVACLMLSRMSNGECPVILWDHSESLERNLRKPYIYADSFGEYFLKKIRETLEYDASIP